MAIRGRKKAIAKPAPPARDPRDVETIERLQQRIQKLEFQQLQQDLPAEETKTESNVWDNGSEDVNPFGGGNSFQEEHIMLMDEESCPVYDTDNEEEESMPVYDTDIEDVIEEEEGFVGIEESSERSFKDDSLLDAANLLQLNNVPIDSDSVASSHNRVHGGHDSLNRDKRWKFKGRGRVPRAAKNEMSMASNFVDEGASHSKQHIEDYGGEHNVTGDPKNGCGIPFNWSRIHDLGKSFLDIGRSLSCGLSDSSQRHKSRHQNLTQKYMPQTFRDLMGHNLAVQALSNAIAKKKVGLLYVFYGPHGIGKTSCARIFARALTCESFGSFKSVRVLQFLCSTRYGEESECSHNELIQTDDSHYFKMVQLQLSAPSTKIQSPHRMSVSASPTSVMSSAPNTLLMNLFCPGFSMSSPYSVQVDASFESDYEDNSKKLSHPKPSQFRLMKMNSPEWVTALWGCLGVIGCGAIQTINAYCVGGVINVYFQTTKSTMVEHAKIPDIMERMEMAVGWWQSNMKKIDDFLKRYAMSHELKVVQTAVIESTTTTQVEGTGDKKNQDEEAKDKKKGKGNNIKGNKNKGKKINDNAYKIELLGHYNMSATFDVFDLSPYFGESDDEENSRMSFSQAGEEDAGTLDRNVNLVEYLEF
uniref:Putative multidrug resistance protein n=1 Tax=Tanacetum cinerariifolium TaxID=118510 RepID=A0A699HY97_TANCI|nr:putative multidrug resistance protein [Tanacetum cinerariifolium]